MIPLVSGLNPLAISNSLFAFKTFSLLQKACMALVMILEKLHELINVTV